MKWFQAFYLLLNSNRRIGLTSYHVCPLTIYMLLLIFHITHATCLKTLNNKQYLKNEYFSTDAKVSTITYSHFIVGTYRSWPFSNDNCKIILVFNAGRQL